MPSIAESKRQVKACLQSQDRVNHEDILASLQDEIDRHNEVRSSNGSKDEKGDGKTHQEAEGNISRSSTRFRFKRKRNSRDDEPRRRHKRRKEVREGTLPEEGAAHPFPREPTEPDQTGSVDPNAAFRESLFDALADDEGAAYWESVYSQPIHVYARPDVESAKGGIEQMNDEEYAAYVQTKMWEKKNPHIVLERQRREKQRKEEEEERTRQREEFVRKKQRAAWERAERAGAKKFAGVDDDDADDYEYTFDFDGRANSASKRSTEKSRDEHQQAWREYLAAWTKLKHELLEDRSGDSTKKSSARDPAKCIPWPVLHQKPVIRPNIEDFMQYMPLDKEGQSKTQLLKAERVRWHPDKIQQRFGGRVDEGTMKVVTGIFQVVDALLEAERQRVAR